MLLFVYEPPILHEKSDDEFYAAGCYMEPCMIIFFFHVSLIGKVQSEANSDGYFFKDKASEKLMKVSGDCVITYDP